MFDKITIVNVDGRLGDLHDTQLALQHSAIQMPGARCLLISPAPRPPRLPPSIEHIPIAPMGYLEYSLFATFALHQFIDTEYALIVQNDGWVFDGASFNKDFLEFDYLGAPAHMAEVIAPESRLTKTRFSWVRDEVSHTVGTRINYLMNGGFSLRSRKFLKTPAELGLDYRLRPPQIKKSHQGVYQMEWPGGDVAEDVYHCILNRQPLEEAGIRFPPLCVGLKFAFEHLNPILHADMDIGAIFGHHAKVRRLISLDPLILRYTGPESEIRSLVWEPAVIDAFRKRGYEVQFTAR